MRPTPTEQKICLLLYHSLEKQLSFPRYFVFQEVGYKPD
jgi:hypothetical protein